LVVLERRNLSGKSMGTCLYPSLVLRLEGFYSNMRSSFGAGIGVDVILNEGVVVQIILLAF